jgi:iron(III) transport system substrate-binding protein
VKKVGFLTAYTSEQMDIIPDKFKDIDDCWTGIWYDPMVFVVNQEFLKLTTEVPHTWSDLTKNNKIRIAMTDFLASDASANLFYSLAIANGEEKNLEYLKQIHPQVIQYAKFLATPVRMAGMGECDIAIAAQSESLRYLYDHFPINIIYPEEGTSFLLTGAGLLGSAPHRDEAKNFLDWLIGDHVQTILTDNKF